MEFEELFLCECSSDEHQFIVRYEKCDENDIYDEVYVSVHLTHYKSFWKRVVAGFRYMFGYRSKYGHWDTFTIRPKDAKKLQAIVDHLNAIEKARTEKGEKVITI